MTVNGRCYMALYAAHGQPDVMTAGAARARPYGPPMQPNGFSREHRRSGRPNGVLTRAERPDCQPDPYPETLFFSCSTRLNEERAYERGCHATSRQRGGRDQARGRDTHSREDANACQSVTYVLNSLDRVRANTECESLHRLASVSPRERWFLLLLQFSVLSIQLV